MRRLFLCVLLGALGLMCFLAPSAGAEIVTLDGIRYEIKDGYATFAGFAEGAGSVTAHAAVNGWQARYTMDVSMDNQTVKDVVVSPEITDLDQIYSFRSLLFMCGAAERIVLPAALARIGENLSNLSISLREFVVADGNAAYRAIDGVLFSKDGGTLLAFPAGKGERYDIPAGTVAVERGAFGYNELLTHLTVPEGITQLPESTVWGLPALKEIVLPASLAVINSGMLPSGGALERITMADDNPHYQSVDGVLFTKDGKTLVAFPSGRGGHYDIPPGTAAIMDYAFSINTSLESLVVPEGVTEISNGMFSQMDGLKRLFLPASLRSIGSAALPGHGELEQITVAEGNEQYQTYDGALFSRDGKTLLVYPAGRSGTYEIPPGTLFIDDYAFGGNGGLTGITVPDGVTALADYLFSNLGGLEAVYLPASLRQIGTGALPDYGALQRVEVAQGNQRYRSMDGVLFEGSELIHYPPSHGLSYDIPAGTTGIRQGAFSNNKMLETVSIPRSVTEIGEETFFSCTALARVSLPITLAQIGRSAFANCISLSGITLPPGLAVLGEGAFFNCPSLAQIRIPDGIKELGRSTFGGHSPGFVLYAAKGSAGYWHAWEYDLLWAEPGDAPGTVMPTERQTKSAVVNNASNQELLSLSSEPAKGAKSLGKYINGTTVQIVDTQGDWAHVRLYGAEGYMPSESLMLTDKFNALRRITWGRKRQEITEPLRLYAGPSQEAPSEVVKEDASMRILDTVGVWYHVQLLGREGYVPVQYLNVVHNQMPDYENNISYYVVANPKSQDRLHLREQPSTKSPSLGRYFNGTQVEVLEDSSQEGWVHVRVDGKEGYMMSQYLIFIGWGGEENLWGHG